MVVVTPITRIEMKTEGQVTLTLQRYFNNLNYHVVAGA